MIKESGQKMLKDTEKIRYSRQIRLFGEAGQEKLKSTKVFIAGAGGLGSVVSLYMAAAGFGTIRIVDCDSVELSNLNRQILHASKSVGRSKSDSALETIGRLNPEIEVEAIVDTINMDNIGRLLLGCDLIMDAMDNFQTRYILNRAALKNKLPLFHGAINGYQGQATTVIPGESACFACIFPRAPPVVVFPALGSTCGVIGSIQVTEAVKYTLGAGELLQNRILLWDGQSSSMDEVTCERDPCCRECAGY